MRSHQESYCEILSVLEAAQSLRPRAGIETSRDVLWQVIQTALSAMARQVTALREGSEAAEEFLRHAREHLDFFTILLGFVEASEATRIPQALIRPFEQLTQASIPGVDQFGMLVWYEWGPSNYSFRVRFADQLRSAVDAVFAEAHTDCTADVPDCFACVSFPAAHREDVLLHSALAHEVGHAIAEKRNDLRALSDLGRVDRDELLEAVLATGDGRSLPGLFQTIHVNRADRMRANWLSELLADAWGVYLVGPAVVLALRQLAEVQYAAETHPPTSLRYPLMMDALERAGFTGGGKCARSCEWLGVELEEIAQMAEEGKPDSQDDPCFYCVHEALARATSDILDHVYSTAGESGRPYTVTDWKEGTACQDGTNALCTRLLHYVPPDTLDGGGAGGYQPAKLPSILNAGWAVYLCDEDWRAFCDGLGAGQLKDSHNAKTKLNRLLLKAVELVDMHDHWSGADAPVG